MGHKLIPRVPPEGPNQKWYGILEDTFQHYEETMTPASVAAAITVEQTFTVTGINSNDIIILNPPSITAGIGIAGVRASAKNTIAITFINTTAGALTPPAGSYNIIAIKG
jgi:hypothetical protein